jgi:hypothetical protein
VYNKIVNQPLLEGGYRVVFKLLDKGLFEYFGPTGLGISSFQLGRFFASLQTGRVYDYAFFMLVVFYAYLALINLFD